MNSKVDGANVAINNMKLSDNVKNAEMQKQNDSENNKVEQIKKSIQEGTYKIDLNKTAQKIADTLL
ncbi:MAG: flagellar biosynthesis anti-sigma factor FlgM [Epsilonproteobacteria bacterium]|nr:flagellar biosynthesis anti-sigma factor FlgM [Campylobacterota bacterium]